MGVTLKFEQGNLAQLISGLAARQVAIEVRLVGPHAMAGRIWEWGRVDINPGPKTAWSSFGPSDERRVMTLTAPFGWIRVNRQKYIQFIRQELKKIPWSKYPVSQWQQQAEVALSRAADSCKELMAETAPVDTGELREEIRNSTVQRT